MLQTAFRPSCMNRASVFEWHKRFKEDRDSVRDDERCGRTAYTYNNYIEDSLKVKRLSNFHKNYEVKS